MELDVYIACMCNGLYQKHLIVYQTHTVTSNVQGYKAPSLKGYMSKSLRDTFYNVRMLKPATPLSRAICYCTYILHMCGPNKD